MSDNPEIVGGTTLPADAVLRLGEFVDWLDENYHIDNGGTALFWSLSHQLAAVVKEKQ